MAECIHGRQRLVLQRSHLPNQFRQLVVRGRVKCRIHFLHVSRCRFNKRIEPDELLPKASRPVCQVSHRRGARLCRCAKRVHPVGRFRERPAGLECHLRLLTTGGRLRLLRRPQVVQVRYQVPERQSGIPSSKSTSARPQRCKQFLLPATAWDILSRRRMRSSRRFYFVRAGERAQNPVPRHGFEFAWIKSA